MNLVLRLGVICVFGLVLAACETQKPIPINQAAASQIKTIGFLAPSVPEEPAIQIDSSGAYAAGGQGGALGSLIASAVVGTIESSRESEFEKGMIGEGVLVQKRFTTALNEALTEKGYSLVPAFGERASRSDFATQYRASAPVDAYLDVVMVNYGYATGSGDTPYRPFIGTKVRLLDGSTQQVLMEDTVSFGEEGVPGYSGGVELPTPRYAAYPNFETILLNIKPAIRALAQGLDDSATAIVGLLD